MLYKVPYKKQSRTVKEYELQNIEIEALLKAAMNENDSLFKSILERAKY